MPDAGRGGGGPAAVLGLAYGFFTLAAGARSGVQLATHGGRAPLAYALSAVAAAVYLAGAVLVSRGARAPGPASVLCTVELAGVVVVGTASVLAPGAFPDATVWSWYGSGYAFVPAVLPLLALAWLHTATRPGRRGRAGRGAARGSPAGRGR